MIITSMNNPRVRELQSLSKPRDRKASGLFVIEGRKEIMLALDHGYDFESLWLCREIGEDKEIRDLSEGVSAKGIPLVEISAHVFSKLAYRENRDGVLGVAHAREHDLNDLVLPATPLIIVLEAVEKPGNLGAILRTADAAGVDAVILCDPGTDLYNPNVVRSSIGCLFTQQIAVASSSSALAFLRERGVSSYAAYLTAKLQYHEADFRKASAIVMGTEADGLSEFWLKNSDQGIIIPMRGAIDSLNVSTSTAIIVFEAMRQRGFGV